MTRRLFLQPDVVEIGERLPVILDHREWCQHLQRRGQLSEAHRRCVHTLVCVASAFQKTNQDWRYQRRDA